MSFFSQMTQAEVNLHNARVAGLQPGVEASTKDAVEVESALHCDIMYECRQRGWLYFHGSMAHKARRTLGEPDFVILADGGRVFFVEAKARNGKRSPAQLGVAIQAEILGHKVHLVSCLSDFLAIVKPPTPTTP